MTEQRSDQPLIRSPDQRLRVFVSSTLGEMAEERKAVSQAIVALRLTPVMFEAGARPHPPTELYRAYLAQSDVFVGLYWQRYGWVGPGMEISGLEDELVRSSALPRLVYLKEPAPERESGLSRMLDRLRNEGALSYRHFRNPAELGRLVRDDLAALLSERFAFARDAVAGGRPAAYPPRAGRLPAATTSLVGREQAITDVIGLIDHLGARLVTLTGPGGVGKTRLAMAAGERLSDRMHGKVAFVDLAGVTSHDHALSRIGRALGVDLGQMGAPLPALIEQLDDESWLLILDNVEQVLQVGNDLKHLLAHCPNVTILATSRIALNLDAEREYPVPTLALPADPLAATDEQLGQAPAVALYLDRARAVHPDFVLTQHNAMAVAEICRRLEGLPLAIELAAARSRLLDPETLLRRLAVSLDALGTGARDLPERQRTLRATVAWSVGLLADGERSLLEVAAVFRGGWTSHAIALVAGLDEDRALELSEALARHSLVHFNVTDEGPRLAMLDTIRAFVVERLHARPDSEDIGRRHADYFRALAEHADRPLRNGGARESAQLLQTEAGNLSAAISWYLDHDRGPLPHLFRVLWPFWAQQDHLNEARAWIAQLLADVDRLSPKAQAELLWTALATANETGDDAGALTASGRLAPLLADIDDPYLHAMANLAMAWTEPIVGSPDAALRMVQRSLELLSHQDEPYWTALATATAAQLEIALGRYDDAQRRITQARNLLGRLDNRWLEAFIRVQLGTLSVARDPHGQARATLDDAFDYSLAAHSTLLVCQCLIVSAWLALAEGDARQAARVAGAADGLRQRVGLRAWPLRRRSEAELLARIRQTISTDQFDEAYAAGSRLNQAEAVRAGGWRAASPG